jgi:hypothetical protein
MNRIKKEFELKNEFLRRPHDPTVNLMKPALPVPVDPVLPESSATPSENKLAEGAAQSANGRVLTDDGVLKSKSKQPVNLSDDQLSKLNDKIE